MRCSRIIKKELGDVDVGPRGELGAKGVVIFELTLVIKQVDVAEDTGGVKLRRSLSKDCQGSREAGVPNQPSAGLITTMAGFLVSLQRLARSMA